MILKNPENGAAIVKFSSQGRYWNLAVGETTEVEDSVGQDLVNTYGFLEEIPSLSVKPEVLKVGSEFKCSVCDYQNKVKVAVFGHIKSHGVMVEAKKLEPVGEAKKNPTIFEARAARFGMYQDKDAEELQGVDKDGVEWVGEGYQENRPASHNMGGVPGRFGAAS